MSSTKVSVSMPARVESFIKKRVRENQPTNFSREIVNCITAQMPKAKRKVR